MSDQSVNVTFDANVDGLLGALGTAKAAIHDTFSADNQSSDLFRTMERSSDIAIRNMIRGTQSWQSALMGMAGNIEVRFAQMAARKALGWIQSEGMMTAATQASNALRMASDEGATTASLASKAQGAISSILNSAKEVFGGIFAFLSPMMGPGAAGPAAAGSASVAALASDIVYAESGAWHIPNNTMAYLHAGEMVVPQPFADSLRAGGGLGGGGDAYNITIQAIDTQTGAQFLKNNAGAIASAISGQVRNFNRQVPAWKS